MAIIKFTKKAPSPQDYALLNIYPNQFVSEKDKQTDDWIKVNMDYNYNRALQQYIANKRRFVRNYELIKGILKREDFYNEPAVQSFTDTLLKSEDLPAYVKHYNIMAPAINAPVGELSKRPDNVFVKAFDEGSQAEEMQYKTDILMRYLTSIVKERLSAKYAEQGLDLEEDELEQMTAERVNEEISTYTSTAEKWASRMLEYLKMRFNMKEKSEDAFRDLLITGRHYFHIYEDNTELGLGIEVLNPKNVCVLGVPDERYTSDPLDKVSGAYNVSIVEIMELSEIINKFDITKEEIDHLRELSQQAFLINSRESNLTNPGVTGGNSVMYDTYDPAVLQYRNALESELLGEPDELADMLGITTSVSTFGNKYVVVTSYWCSKKKIGKLTFINEDGQEETVLVDENYKEGVHPQEISIEWGWINQWYKGIKIGLDVYYVKPLKILDYCPIIGAVYENKNVPTAPSLVDQMKPFQMLYNVAMNQLFRLLEKDMGVVFLNSIRHVPVPKDGDYQDAVEIWEAEARERGIIFIDDSPENMKAPSAFNAHKAIDLSRHNEIEARYNLAVEMRNECWKLVGLSEQRLGESRATETATAVNSALTQSYAQTEPWFSQQEYTMNKVYQALLDAAMYVESQKPTSTISYISGEGEKAFVTINGSDLKLKEFGVFVTSRAEDARNYQEFKQLAQAMLQNGATPYEVSLMYTTKSIRRMSEILKKLKEKQDQFQQQQQQLEQQQLQQQQQQFNQAQEAAQIQDQQNKAFEAYENEKERISNERIAYIQAASKNQGVDGSDNTLDLSRFEMEKQKAYNDYSTKALELAQKQQQLLLQNSNEASKLQLDKEKLAVEREKMKSQERIAKENRTASEIKAKKASKKK